jgi:signal transduction histidine kinase
MEYTNLPEVSSAADTQQASKKPVILVIDDELGPRESLKILLSDIYSVLIATNGDEGINMLTKYPVETIILDLKMPGKSGIETLEEIRKINIDVPVVVLTGFGTLEAAQKAVHLDIFEFVNKPFDITEMKDIVKRSIEKYRIKTSTKNIINQLQDLNLTLEGRIHQLEKFAMVGELSTELLHEINNPLTIILGYIQIIIAEINEKNQSPSLETQRYLQVVENEVKRCQSIAKSFLDISKKTFKYIKVDINLLIKNMIYFLKDNPIAMGIKFFCECDPELPLIMGSQEQLQQVFTNLFINAIEATKPGGSITVLTKKDKDRAIIKVIDTGSGMSPDVVSKIFKPFFTTKQDRSTGIGLIISKKIIEAHKGTISVESEEGKGTTFTISFPAYLSSV